MKLKSYSCIFHEFSYKKVTMNVICITLNGITILRFHEFLPLQIVSDDDVHHYIYVNVCMQAPLYQMNATRPCDVYRGRSSTLQ